MTAFPPDEFSVDLTKTCRMRDAGCGILVKMKRECEVRTFPLQAPWKPLKYFQKRVDHDSCLVPDTHDEVAYQKR